jgi:hypothetical protein
MAHRPSPEELDRPLTPEELTEYKRGLTRLPPSEVAEAYQRAYERCRMEGDRTPRARSIQELVTAWKLIWARRRNRRWMGRG